MKRNIILSIAVILAVGGIFLYLRHNNSSQEAVSPEVQNNNKEELILFVSNSCPHCKNVETFLQENNVNEKLTINQREVSENKDNAELLIQKAKKCGIAPSEVGVPLLWDGSKCLVGDNDIINFIQTKIK